MVTRYTKRRSSITMTALLLLTVNFKVKALKVKMGIFMVLVVDDSF